VIVYKPVILLESNGRITEKFTETRGIRDLI
jgi:hypothetical protein